ncbi:PREDICTED: transmembrane channel-like protein 5 isoform X1 [Acromyrmex echinatior]|nr:PREDICTED: transmembrane channel-like protein 5 isoform X1 [Acromyrmex echinatior]XP_011049435.1 PREDICTED: transmembrane channel-like protein 5 isoform X1 [Acromyrmex echinatior]XP_011049444.1 PREDICTED: transmembrane channel-like protein 5 isoform X1 [Acromyrmex echinatior]
MPFEIQEAELCESFDQSIQMEQLLPMELGRKHEGILDLNSIIPYATLRMRNVAHLSNEECANAIASHLQSSEKFMHDDPKLEQFRMETVRTIPQCLAVKQSVKLQLLETVNQKTTKRSISCWKLFKYNVSLKFTKIWITMQNFLSTMKLWHRTIKTIESHHGSGIATYFKFLRWLFFLNTISCILSVSFIVIPQSLDQVYVSNDIKVLDFLTGSGFLSHTIMYYGFYSNGTVDVSFGTKYSIPFAYFLTLLFCYIVTFVILSLKVISSYRKSYVETRGKVHNLYSSKIFCGWDFSISSPKTAVLQSASIYKELEELLAETKQHMRLHWCTKFLLIIIQFAATSIVIFMIFGAGALVWILLSHYNIETPVTISIMIVPIVITAIIHIFPAIISYLALLERYNNKRTELYVTIVRNYAVAAIIIGTLFIFWITHSMSYCWQTHLGEEIYRLIVLDFIASLFGAFLHFIRSVLYKRYSTKVGKSEFDIARSTLNLIYNQMLFWMGFYFSPLISIMIMIKLIFTFYIKRYELKRYYQRPSQPWRAAQTQTLSLALTFLSIIVILFTIGYVITNVKSDECGPFRNHLHTWDFIVDGMLSLKRDSTFWKVISELASPVTGAVILIGMSIAVYCLRAKAEASKEISRIFSNMLLLQSQDKQFLINSFGKCAENKHTFVPNEISFVQDIRHIEQDCTNEEALLHRHNLPSTSFEER